MQVPQQQCKQAKPSTTSLSLPVYAQVCSAVKQESTEAVYLMLLDKSPTQEEFIRGQLTNNPYNSAETGPLMRDVKNFICRELDMEGESPTRSSDKICCRELSSKQQLQ